MMTGLMVFVLVLLVILLMACAINAARGGTFFDWWVSSILFEDAIKLVGVILALIAGDSN